MEKEKQRRPSRKAIQDPPTPPLQPIYDDWTVAQPVTSRGEVEGWKGRSGGLGDGSDENVGATGLEKTSSGCSRRRGSLWRLVEAEKWPRKGRIL